jgi:UbiD family decarboxylase
LRVFLLALRQAGELRVVEAPVDANLEVAEIHRRVIAAGGPAVLFERVEGKEFPLVTNLFGSRRRAEIAFGANAERFFQRMVEVLQSEMTPSLGTA